jgi:hypothetical protein
MLPSEMSSVIPARTRPARQVGTAASYYVEWGKKKAGMVEYPRVLNHAGLRCDGPPGKAGVPFD